MRHAARIAALDVVSSERQRQNDKWGPLPFAHTDLRWFAILSEEVGEVAKELVDRNERIDVITEVVHVAATAMHWLEQYYYDTLGEAGVDKPTDGSGS